MASTMTQIQEPVSEPEYLKSPVCSYNEWDLLEEVIVGRPQGARVPKLGPEVKVIFFQISIQINGQICIIIYFQCH